jgi:hypothetical protein
VQLCNCKIIAETGVRNHSMGKVMGLAAAQLGGTLLKTISQ